MARRRSEEGARSRGRERTFFHYRLAGDWRVVAGRAAADNEELSLRMAQPEDWWFHVKGTSGSHVILRAEEGREPDRATLETAAGIAAYHSKARGGGTVAVSCTRARFVTKPRGAPRGTVEIRRETTYKVRPFDPTELRVEPS